MLPGYGMTLSPGEAQFVRMEAYHRERVTAIQNNESPLIKSDTGIFVIHLIPRACVSSFVRIDLTKLKEYADKIPPPGSRYGGQSRLNVDGVFIQDGYKGARAYIQIFRDGRAEVAMSDIWFQSRFSEDQASRCIRTAACELAILTIVPQFLAFYSAIGVQAPIALFTALVGCDNVRHCADSTFGDLSQHAIDRSPLFLPDVEFTDLNVDPKPVLRAWCDSLWQSWGVQQSYNFDAEGNWREPRR